MVQRIVSTVLMRSVREKRDWAIFVTGLGSLCFAIAASVANAL